MVRAQMLSELEEIIAYKQFADQPERQQIIRKTWVKRFVRLSILVPLLKVLQTPGLSA
jgi:FAT domain